VIIRKICDACGLEYDWAGVTVGDRIYCCAACAQGLPCTCPQHQQAVVTPADDTVIVEE
jgi:hypothetical protein